jgi:hypothetical protein
MKEYGYCPKFKRRDNSAHLQVVYYNCVKFHKNSIGSLVGVVLTRYMPTVVVHILQMCMKEYGCCPKFKRGVNSTYTFTKRGGHVPFSRSCAYKVHAPPFS